ncbi:MAG: glycoside hydrolase family 3 N-terminal domain-containing protein, partial [Ktedonobacterales bacterium]
MRFSYLLSLGMLFVAGASSASQPPTATSGTPTPVLTATREPTLVTGILRGQPCYQCIIVTDALGAQSILIYMKQQRCSDPVAAIAEASVRAFLAGDDLLLCPLAQNEPQAVVTAMTHAVQSGHISSQRLHNAVHRILCLKVGLGL